MPDPTDSPNEPDERRGLLGGRWLDLAAAPSEVFTPEQLPEEARLVGSTVTELVTREILPRLPQLEQQDWDTARRLVERCGQVGLLGIDVPVAVGGSAAGTIASVVASERMAAGGSFRTTTAVQTNLVILPLTIFGTDAQQHTYVPSLVSGRRIGAFCLTESGSGSDAFSATSTATPAGDGRFRLCGEKQWITNGGIADLFVVFATVPGHGLTAFLVDRASAGVEPGREERKMGLHGCSTTPVSFSDVIVPSDRVLGKVGRGRDVALTALNYARLKLGAMCVGDAKNGLADACQYAADRRQFGRPIGRFGAVAHKLGEMVVRVYVAESIVYRTAGMVDAARRIGVLDDCAARRAAIDAGALEASIVKVAGSEMLDWVLDEAVQVHGANGYSRDFPVERRYRDARPNRIFEGTNEINRLFLAGTLVKRSAPASRAESGDVVAAGRDRDAAGRCDGTPQADLARRLEQLVRVVVELAAAARPAGPSQEQEVLLRVADLVIDAYGVQSALRRATAETTGVRPRLHAAAAATFLHDAADRMRAASRAVAGMLLNGDGLRQACAAIDRLTASTPANGALLRRTLAEAAIECGGYPLEY
jgi:alkylation response protein AidB-like acyl-CoA dehydrogenase